MVRVLFVCLGNICRSPMGEFIFKDIAARANVPVFAVSAGTSDEEEGNPVYPPARAELARHGISCAGKRARRLERADYDNFDYILAMETSNVRGILRICGGDPQDKVFRLLDFSARPRDIADPWYTGDFASTYADIAEGCEAFLHWLAERGRAEQKGGGER